jgi:hypothetical protein
MVLHGILFGELNLTEIPLQNTWPAIAYGDVDKDGKMEIWWAPINARCNHKSKSFTELLYLKQQEMGQ